MYRFPVAAKLRHGNAWGSIWSRLRGDPAAASNSVMLSSTVGYTRHWRIVIRPNRSLTQRQLRRAFLLIAVVCLGLASAFLNEPERQQLAGQLQRAMREGEQ